MKTIELTDGATATIRDGSRFTNRRIAEFQAGFFEVGKRVNEWREAHPDAAEDDLPDDLSIESVSALLASFIVSWTVLDEDGETLPLPSVRPDVVLDLTPADTQLILDAVVPEFQHLVPSFEPTLEPESPKAEASTASPLPAAGSAGTQGGTPTASRARKSATTGTGSSRRSTGSTSGATSRAKRAPTAGEGTASAQ